MTGMMLPRNEMTPSTPAGMLGVFVMGGVFVTSRTLNTLIPNVSRVPKLKSRISILLDPASLVRASTVSRGSWSTGFTAMPPLVSLRSSILLVAVAEPRPSVWARTSTHTHQHRPTARDAGSAFRKVTNA